MRVSVIQKSKDGTLVHFNQQCFKRDQDNLWEPIDTREFQRLSIDKEWETLGYISRGQREGL